MHGGEYTFAVKTSLPYQARIQSSRRQIAALDLLRAKRKKHNGLRKICIWNYS